MARPSKFTPERAARIIAGLKSGMTRTAASGHAGVSYDSLNLWAHRYASFASQMAEAEAAAEARYSGVIAQAAFGHEVVKTVTLQGIDKKTGEPVTETRTETYREYDWRAALEWLKRRRREDWGDEKPALVQPAQNTLIVFLEAVRRGEFDAIVNRVLGPDPPRPLELLRQEQKAPADAKAGQTAD